MPRGRLGSLLLRSTPPRRRECHRLVRWIVTLVAGDTKRESPRDKPVASLKFRPGRWCSSQRESPRHKAVASFSSSLNLARMGLAALDPTFPQQKQISHGTAETQQRNHGDFHEYKKAHCASPLSRSLVVKPLLLASLSAPLRLRGESSGLVRPQRRPPPPVVIRHSPNNY